VTLCSKIHFIKTEGNFQFQRLFYQGRGWALHFQFPRSSTLQKQNLSFSQQIELKVIQLDQCGEGLLSFWFAEIFRTRRQITNKGQR